MTTDCITESFFSCLLVIQDLQPTNQFEYYN